MSEQFSAQSVRLTVSHSTPSEPTEAFAQPEDLMFNPPQSDQICMGRSPSNEIPLNHAAVSGQHARIVRQGNEFFLEELGSRNGTILNGTRLNERESKLLRSGDHIRIVPYDIRFVCGVEVYNQLPPTENTAMIRDEMIRSVLGGVMGHEDKPPKLIVMSGGQASMQQFELSGMHADYRIGRAPQCDLVIQDENISREHAAVRRDPSGVMIRDLNSRNGVVVNGRRLAKGVEHALRDRDEITLGTAKLQFSDPEGAALAEMIGDVVNDPVAEQAAVSGSISVPQPNSPPPSGVDVASMGEEGLGEGGEALEANSSDAPEVPGLDAPSPDGANELGEAGVNGEEGEALGAEGGEEGEAGGLPVPVEPGLTSTQITVIATVVVLVVLGAVWLFMFSG
ncbi:MAG: FHA domain-containing protein [Deltaproteobacteria bacterium]|nr:MAG: FHA domain-containing protein [Deltaproteobacteria bacterium]